MAVCDLTGSFRGLLYYLQCATVVQCLLDEFLRKPMRCGARLAPLGVPPNGLEGPKSDPETRPEHGEFERFQEIGRFLGRGAVQEIEGLAKEGQGRGVEVLYRGGRAINLFLLDEESTLRETNKAKGKWLQVYRGAIGGDAFDVLLEIPF